jgi:hypothetical protein
LIEHGNSREEHETTAIRKNPYDHLQDEYVFGVMWVKQS